MITKCSSICIQIELNRTAARVTGIIFSSSKSSHRNRRDGRRDRASIRPWPRNEGGEGGGANRLSAAENRLPLVRVRRGVNFNRPPPPSRPPGAAHGINMFDLRSGRGKRNELRKSFNYLDATLIIKASILMTSAPSSLTRLTGARGEGGMGWAVASKSTARCALSYQPFFRLRFRGEGLIPENRACYETHTVIVSVSRPPPPPTFPCTETVAFFLKKLRELKYLRHWRTHRFSSKRSSLETFRNFLNLGSLLFLR